MSKIRKPASSKLTTAPLHRRAKQEMRLITAERSVFMSLTGADNLRLGNQERSRCLELFSELESLLSGRTGLMSGGNQQMLTHSPAPQEVRNALEVADRAIVLNVGRVVLEGSTGERRLRIGEIEQTYLATGEFTRNGG